MNCLRDMNCEEKFEPYLNNVIDFIYKITDNKFEPTMVKLFVLC
jgi:hypothetical protein